VRPTLAIAGGAALLLWPALLNGYPLVFSDTNGKTAILITGIWRPDHMKGARGTMLCLYDRGSRTAEVTEAKNWKVVAPAKP
jgi:hypothetical protein